MKDKIMYILDEISFFFEDLPKGVKVLLIALIIGVVGFSVYHFGSKPKEDVPSEVTDVSEATEGQTLVLYGNNTTDESEEGSTEEETEASDSASTESSADVVEENPDASSTGSSLSNLKVPEEEYTPVTNIEGHDVAVVGEVNVTNQSSNIYDLVNSFNVDSLQFNIDVLAPQSHYTSGVGASYDNIKDLIGTSATVLQLQDAVLLRKVDTNTFILKTSNTVSDDNLLVLRLYSSYPDDDDTLSYYNGLQEGQLCVVSVPLENTTTQSLDGHNVLVVSYDLNTIELRHEED